MNRTAANGVTVLITALAIGAMGYRTWTFLKIENQSEPEAVLDWEKLVTDGQRVGPPDALVTIVTFSDFACSFCALAALDISRLLQKHKDISFVYRYYPTGTSAHGVNAVRAAECSAAFGRFKEYHDLLYSQVDSIGAKTWIRFAKEAGIVSLDAFDDCLLRLNPDPVIARDTAVANSLGFRKAPMLLINGFLFHGYPGARAMEQHVERILNQG